MKVAIVLFGNMRTYDQCYKNIEKYITSKYESDFYIHTWDILDRTTSSHKNNDSLLASKKVSEDDILKCYPGAKVQIDEVPQFDKEYDATGKFELSGPKCMYLSLNRSLSLMLSSKINYDLVVITRPDIFLKGSLDLNGVYNYINNYGRDLIFRAGYFAATNSKSVNVLDSWGASDCLMVCNKDVASKLVGLSKRHDLLKLPYIKWVETQLDYFLVDNNIKSLHLNYIAPENWAILRRTKENSDFKVDIMKQLLVVMQSFMRIVSITRKRILFKYLN
ncbi:hypothetical protein PWG11_17970 (plasmid) [Proteus mirabilis]|uniref:hypothetical protein n=1 Tax=Proteus mirabilis TaxID=584 RepID=UPI0038F5E62C